MAFADSADAAERDQLMLLAVKAGRGSERSGVLRVALDRVQNARAGHEHRDRADAEQQIAAEAWILLKVMRAALHRTHRQRIDHAERFELALDDEQAAEFCPHTKVFANCGPMAVLRGGGLLYVVNCKLPRRLVGSGRRCRERMLSGGVGLSCTAV